MNIFFISVMPLFYWAVQNLFDNQNVRIRDIILPFVLGFLIAVPVQLFYWAMDIYFGMVWKPVGLYFYTFFNKEGFLFYPLVLLILFWYRKKAGGSLYVRELAGLFCGYFFLVAFIDMITGSHIFTSYDLLILPLFRIVTLLTASMLINRFLSASGRNRYFLLAGILLFPLVLNFFPLLYLLNRILIASIIFVPVFIVVLLVSYFDLQGKIFN